MGVYNDNCSNDLSDVNYNTIFIKKEEEGSLIFVMDPNSQLFFFYCGRLINEEFQNLYKRGPSSNFYNS